MDLDQKYLALMIQVAVVNISFPFWRITFRVSGRGARSDPEVQGRQAELDPVVMRFLNINNCFIHFSFFY